MSQLAGKHIVLGLSGGIACYKAAELCRALVKAGATVQVVMTDAAEHFITAITLQALSGRSVYTSQWDAREGNNMAHINLSREADAIVVAPASADFLSKLLHGGADELLSLMCLARPVDKVPLIVAPAMNREMWANPATQRNVAQLKADGIHVLDVGQGDQACGETGDGRMLEADEILEDLEAFFTPKSLVGKQVLVTAGPTYEAIDPVRGITNLSSGKMGFSIARAARLAGADVTLIAGPVGLPTPRGVHRVDVRSALDMLQAVEQNMGRSSFRPPPSPTGARPRPPTRRSRKTVLARRPNWALLKTPTFWPRWPNRPVHSLANCFALVLLPKATTCWRMPPPSVRARMCRCWWATSAPAPLGRTTTPCCWSMRRGHASCRVPPRKHWPANSLMTLPAGWVVVTPELQA